MYVPPSARGTICAVLSVDGWVKALLPLEEAILPEPLLVAPLRRLPSRRDRSERMKLKVPDFNDSSWAQAGMHPTMMATFVSTSLAALA